MTKTKKIIISSYDDLKNPYYHGGGAISVHEVAKGLQATYDVTVLTSKHKVSQKDERIDGVAYMRIGYTPDFFAPLGQLIFLMILPWYAKKLKFDLWIESFTPPFSTAFLPLWTRKPVIGLVHFLSGKEMRRRYKLPFDLIERFGLKHYKQFIVPNAVTAESIARIVPEATIDCIPNGVYLPKKSLTQREKIVTFIGRIEVAQKGLDLLAAAISSVKSDADWTYVIAGTGMASEVEHFHKLVSELGLGTKIQFVGRIDGAKKDALLKKTAIMVVPSRFETFSLSALEALAYGIPVVTFAIDGVKWLPIKGTLQTPTFDTDRFAKNIRMLEKDESKRLTMGRINREAAKQYEWKSVIALYKKVVQGAL